jgi:hypothetical protein
MVDGVRHGEGDDVGAGVFINYRGEDSRSYAALLHLELSRAFGAELVFLDSESIPAGADFVTELLARVRTCRVLLAVIGPRWLAVADGAGRRRIDNADDWIRRELVEAFAAGTVVIPILTDGADLPGADDLPADIAVLSRCQYRRLRHRDASADFGRILADLVGADSELAAAMGRQSAVPGAPSVRQGPTDGGHRDLERRKPRPFEASSGRIDAVATDTPPRRTPSRLTRRRTKLTTLIAVILLAPIGSLLVFHRDGANGPPSVPPSVERALALFAAAQKFDQDGRAKDSQATIADAVRLYGELIKLDPGHSAPPLAPAIIQALRRAGVDFSVAEATVRTWLANPDTPYPSISQVLLLQGWRLKAPVYLDVIVSNYEQTSGITPPRSAADVRPDVLRTAILKGSNERHGTQMSDFEQLLKP